ncbi:DUF3267 domain-containing protein [Salinicoccus albus]|uniref:DUF3267 domain-containing protein n=1 Tax=Salinicoccus albus TaxID=418756 RepID=UPI00037C9A55|nr:DUF3267 domain-containing protein [Salinicoccus albus]
MSRYVLNIFKDTRALKQINIIAVFTTLAVFIPLFITDITGLTGNSGSALIALESIGFFGSLLLIFAIMFAIITVHEGIHGIFFKLFSPNSRVKFGYQTGMFYATSPGEIFSRGSFAVIIIMPFVLITAVLLFMMFAVPHGSYKYFIAFHTGACAGDFYYVYLIMKMKHMKFVEDTNVGMTLYESYPES